jgi:Protein of unknown function (DUF2480)
MQINQSPIKNRVDESGIITFNLEEYFPADDLMNFDLQPFLFQGLILREKDYRKALTDFDFTHFKNKSVCIYCSTDAIIPVWAFMLAATYLQPIAHKIFYGTQEQFIQNAMTEKLQSIDFTQFNTQRIVVKGCGEKPVPVGVYVAITNLLLPHAKTIMYGEPCSTVPLFKRKD